MTHFFGWRRSRRATSRTHRQCSIVAPVRHTNGRGFMEKSGLEVDLCRQAVPSNTGLERRYSTRWRADLVATTMSLTMLGCGMGHDGLPGTPPPGGGPRSFPNPSTPSPMLDDAGGD